MGKKHSIEELTKLMAHGIVHRIGSMVNDKEIYANKYKKESEEFLRKAKEISDKENWNIYDRPEIKEKLKKKVYDELLKRDFLDNKKFEIMGAEIEKALIELELD